MNFFTKQRLIIVSLGLVVAAALIAVATQLENNSLPKDLLVNLAAGAITISFTVAFVEFLLNREKRLSNKDAVKLAVGELQYAGHLLLIPYVKMYDVELESVMDANTACQKILVKLEQLDMSIKNVKAKVNLNKDFVFAIEQSSVPLTEVLQSYAYALPNDMRGHLLKLRNECRGVYGIVSSIQLSKAGEKNFDIATATFYLGLFGDIKKLVEYTQKIEK